MKKIIHISGVCIQFFSDEIRNSSTSRFLLLLRNLWQLLWFFFFSYIIWWQSSINCVYILTIKQQLWNEIRLILTTITWYIYNLLGNPNSTWYIGDNQTILIFVINNLCHFFCYNINQTNKRTEELQSMEKCYFENFFSFKLWFELYLL